MANSRPPRQIGVEKNNSKIILKDASIRTADSTVPAWQTPYVFDEESILARCNLSTYNHSSTLSYGRIVTPSDSKFYAKPGGQKGIKGVRRSDGFRKLQRCKYAYYLEFLKRRFLGIFEPPAPTKGVVSLTIIRGESFGGVHSNRLLMANSIAARALQVKTQTSPANRFVTGDLTQTICSVIEVMSYQFVN